MEGATWLTASRKGRTGDPARRQSHHHPDSLSQATDEVQGVFQERVNGRIKFHTYVVRE